jgi:hypothetical protein
MKHIKELITVRAQQLELQRPTVLSAPVREKGSSEWSTFNVVREDTVGAYRVRMPKKPIVIQAPQHILRIIYPLRRLRGAH